MNRKDRNVKEKDGEKDKNIKVIGSLGFESAVSLALGIGRGLKF